MFSKVKKRKRSPFRQNHFKKTFSRSAVSFEGSGATDWRVPAVGPLCDRPVVSGAYMVQGFKSV